MNSLKNGIQSIVLWVSLSLHPAITSAQESVSQEVSSVVENETQKEMEQRFEQQAITLRKQLTNTKESYNSVATFIETLKNLPPEKRTNTIHALQTDLQIMLGFSWFFDREDSRKKYSNATKKQLQQIFERFQIAQKYMHQITISDMENVYKSLPEDLDAVRTQLSWDIERVMKSMHTFQERYNSLPN